MFTRRYCVCLTPSEVTCSNFSIKCCFRCCSNENIVRFCWSKFHLGNCLDSDAELVSLLWRMRKIVMLICTCDEESKYICFQSSSSSEKHLENFNCPNGSMRDTFRKIRVQYSKANRQTYSTFFESLFYVFVWNGIGNGSPMLHQQVHARFTLITALMSVWSRMVPACTYYKWYMMLMTVALMILLHLVRNFGFSFSLAINCAVKFKANVTLNWLFQGHQFCRLCGIIRNLHEIDDNHNNWLEIM